MHAIFLHFIIVLFPLSVLFIFPEGGFTSDWYNSLYIVGYVGKFISINGYFPTHINAADYLGNHFPVFYGYLLYPLLGTLSACLGVHSAVRVLVFLVYLTQYSLVFTLVRKLTDSKELALVVGILVTWTIYPLSNLYNRSAIPECLASALLISAIAAWFHVLIESQLKNKIFYILCFTLVSSGMAGFHAITAYYGTLILTVFIISSLIVYWNKVKNIFWTHIILLLVAGGLFSLILSPWIYIVFKLKSKLPIATSLGRLAYHDDIDNLWIRFFPLPLDWRSVVGGISTPTSYLEAQINVCLMVFFLSAFLFSLKKVSFDKRIKAASFVCFILFIINTLISCIRALEVQFLSYTSHFQIAYRMVTYSNVFLVIGTFFILKKESRIKSIILTLVVSIAGAGVLLKLIHAAVLLPEANRFAYERFLTGSDDEFLKVPTSFYSFSNYEIPRSQNISLDKIKSKMISVDFIVGKGSSFGLTEPKEITLQRPSWVLTNVSSFLWNQIEVDGHLLDEKEVFGVQMAVSLGIQKINIGVQKAAVFIKSPGKHILRFVHISNPTYNILRGISLLTFLALSFGFFLLFLNLKVVKRAQ